jgi:hypothetical protein
MRTKLLTLVLGTAAALFMASMPAAAHHAFGAEFDANRPILLKGKIVKMEWVNPHTWIHVEITKPDGSKEVWMVEGGSPNSLLRRGAASKVFRWEPMWLSTAIRRGIIPNCGRTLAT